MTTAPAFTTRVETIERTKATATPRKADDAYRPLVGDIANLTDDQALVVDFPDGKAASKAKLSIQIIARESGFTARERKGSRVENADGTVTVSLVKRPLTKPRNAAPETDAPAE